MLYSLALGTQQGLQTNSSWQKWEHGLVLPLGTLIPQNPRACQTTSRHSLWWPGLYRLPQVCTFQLYCPFPSIILLQLWQFLFFFFFKKRNVYISLKLILPCLKGGSRCSNGVITTVSLPGDLHDIAVSFVNLFSLSTETQCPPTRWFCVATLSCPHFSILSDPLMLDH